MVGKIEIDEGREYETVFADLNGSKLFRSKNTKPQGLNGKSLEGKYPKKIVEFHFPF